MSADHPLQNTFKQLIGEDVEPSRHIETDDLESLSTTKVIVDQNYIDLQNFVDDTLYVQGDDGHSNQATPTYTCDNDNRFQKKPRIRTLKMMSE